MPKFVPDARSIKLFGPGVIEAHPGDKLTLQALLAMGEIGPIATPRQVMVVPELPKTRSGKIMRRLLRDVAENREVGDVTTLADSSVMDLISTGLSSGKGED